MVLLDSEYNIRLLGKSFNSVFDIDGCGRTRSRIGVIPFLLISFAENGNSTSHVLFQAYNRESLWKIKVISIVELYLVQCSPIQCPE